MTFRNAFLVLHAAVQIKCMPCQWSILKCYIENILADTAFIQDFVKTHTHTHTFPSNEIEIIFGGKTVSIDYSNKTESKFHIQKGIKYLQSYF